MLSTLPKNNSILKYEDLFNESSPDQPLIFLHGFCKATVLGEFAALNYRLKPKSSMYYDTSLKTQIDNLFYFCGSNGKLFDKYYARYSRFLINKNTYPIIFTRQTCLYAAEEIINSDLKELEGFTLRYCWEKLFQYLLCINSAITRRTDERDDKVDENEVFNLETLNPKLIPLNELSIETNPLYTPFRGYQLMEYLSKHTELGNYFKTYFDQTYQLSFEHFVYELLSMFYGNNKNGVNNITNEFTNENLDTSFYYSIKNKDAILFDALSLGFSNSKTERLISIKKYPFYKCVDGQYLLFDNVLLLDKLYYQFINDFWFDCVRLIRDKDKNHTKYSSRDYRYIIGYFVEHYARDIVRYCFKKAKYHVIKTFDELKVTKEKEQIELADIYIRYDREIFIAEVKSTGLYDDEKYSGDLNKMYRNNREGFFKSFGINQVVESIKNLKKTVQQIDPTFPLHKRCHVFPAVVVNEKAMQTPLMAQIFNQRFIYLMQGVDTGNLKIYSLTLIHISDLEQMEDYLHGSPSKFWQVLKYHLRETAFIPPFYNSLNRLDIRPSFKKSKTLFETLIPRFQAASNK